MNKNNFDEFFREKFKEFGEVPDNKVWEAIESSLDKKRTKRRVIPIWWKLGGVAALLAVLFYIAKPKPGESITPAVVNTESTKVDKTVENEKDTPETNVIDKTNRATEVVQKPQINTYDNPSTSPDNDSQSTGVATVNKQLEVATEKDASKYNSSNPAIVENTSPLASNLPTSNSDKALEDANKQKSEEMLLNTPEVEELSLAETEGKNSNIPKGIETIEKPEEEQLEAVADNIEKKSIFDEIDNEEETVADVVEDRWSLGPSVAPVYFGSFGEGSPIHSNFASNSKSGNFNLSYGLSVSYAVSNKLSVRSGVHKVDYGYDTNDILFSSSLAASTNNRIDNIDYALTSKNLVVQSSANGEPNLDASMAMSNEIAAPSPTRDGRMVQQFGYLEVPVELNYALIDRKLGVNIIGGVSSLFLVENTVSLESNGAATDIGEANNINNLNFSTNIGFGLNYELSSRIQLHLEPMFKYQLNTFSDTSGSFQPFSVGVYSGLNFKF